MTDEPIAAVATPKPTARHGADWRQQPLTAVNVLLLDCQTSGMAAAEVIEIGWQLLPASGGAGQLRCEKVAMADPDDLPKRITKLTGITSADLVKARPYAAVIATIRQQVLAKPAIVVIHYAPFERRFLGDLLATPTVQAVVCSHKLAGRLWPDLPSKSLRSVSGYLGLPVTKLKRSGDHIAATAVIWQAALHRLGEAGVKTWAEVEKVIGGTLAVAPSQDGVRGVKPAKTYRLPRSVRLGLPTGPGVYHLLAADGQLLYVGKATSLKARVNSYFRGQKTKGSRLNELVSQVADVRTYPTGSSLEAELREQQHIAQHQPPYNVALVASGEKTISYIDPQLALHGADAAQRHHLGPFTSTDTVAMLAALCAPNLTPAQVPEALVSLAEYHHTPLADFFQGIGMFLQQQRGQSLRRLALRCWREQQLSVDDDEATESGQPWQADDVCGFLNRRLAGVVGRCYRGRWLRRLRYGDLWWTDGDRSHYLALRGDEALFGSPADILPLPRLPLPRPPLSRLPRPKAQPALLTRHDYDRAAIVMAFIKERLSQKPHEGLWLRCYPGKVLGADRLRHLLPGFKESS